MTIDDAPTQFVNPAYLLRSAPAADCAYANLVFQVHVIVHDIVHACFKEKAEAHDKVQEKLKIKIGV